MGKDKGEGEESESRKVRFVKAAGGTTLRVVRRFGEVAILGTALVGYFGIVKPVVFVAERTVVPPARKAIEKRKERKRREAQEEARRRHEEERREWERRFIEQRDPKATVAAIKRHRRAQQIVNGPEGTAQKILEEYVKRLARSTEGRQRGILSRDPYVRRREVMKKQGKGTKKVKVEQGVCTCCGRIASLTSGCDACRQGWGPPRERPEDVVQRIQRKYRDKQRLPDIWDLVGEFGQGIHRVVKPIHVFVGSGEKPPGVSLKDWRDRTEGERERDAKAIVVWPGGFVGESKLPYRELKERQDRDGTPIWSDPSVFSDTGWRVRPDRPKTGRPWPEPDDVLVSKVTKADKGKGPKKEGKPKSMKLSAWQRESGRFDSAIVWMAGDITRRDRRRDGTNDDAAEGSVVPFSPDTDRVESVTERPLVQDNFWGDIGIEEATERILEAVGSEVLIDRLRLQGYHVEGSHVSCGVCGDDEIGLGLACLNCTETGYLPPTVTAEDVAEYLCVLGDAGYGYTQEDGIALAAEMIGQLHQPEFYFYRDLEEASAVVAAFSNGYTAEILDYEGRTPLRREQLLPLCQREGERVMIHWYLDSSSAPAFDVLIRNMLEDRVTGMMEGLQMSELLEVLSCREELYVQVGNTIRDPRLEDLVLNGTYSLLGARHNAFVHNSLERAREFFFKYVQSIRSPDFWLGKGFRLDEDGVPLCPRGHKFNPWDGCDCNRNGNGPMRITGRSIVDSARIRGPHHAPSYESMFHTIEMTVGDVIPPAIHLRDGDNWIFIWANGFVGRGTGIDDWVYDNVEEVEGLRILPRGGAQGQKVQVIGDDRFDPNEVYSFSQVIEVFGWREFGERVIMQPVV